MPQRNKGQDSGLTLEWDSQGLCSGVSSGITHPGIMGSLPNSLYPFPRAAETSVTNHVTWNNRDVSLISPFWRMKSEIKVSARSGSFWNLEGSIFPCLWALWRRMSLVRRIQNSGDSCWNILGVKCPESCNFQGAQDKGSQNMEREKQTWQNVNWWV